MPQLRPAPTIRRQLPLCRADAWTTLPPVGERSLGKPSAAAAAQNSVRRMNMNNDKDQLRTAALFYHRNPKPGKISLQPTTQLTNQYDLSMAYSPGVAAACEEIVAFPVRSVR
jgi:hypothetical protein